MKCVAAASIVLTLGVTAHAGTAKHALPSEPHRLSFDPSGATIHVDAGDRLVRLDAVTLAERGTLVFPKGAVLLADRGDDVLVGDEGTSFWIGHVATSTFVPVPPPPAARGDFGAQLSPSGRFVVFARTGDVSDSRLELRIDVLDTKAKRWSSFSGLSFPVAGGLFSLCDATEELAIWCYSRGPELVLQRLTDGKVSVRRAPRPLEAGHWSARRNEWFDRAYGKNGIEVFGPGATRWVEVVPEDVTTPEVTTCGGADVALARRDAGVELRTLPAWKRTWTERATATQAACSRDGKRAAWTANEGGAWFVYAHSE